MSRYFRFYAFSPPIEARFFFQGGARQAIVNTEFFGAQAPPPVDAKYKGVRTESQVYLGARPLTEYHLGTGSLWP